MMQQKNWRYNAIVLKMVLELHYFKKDNQLLLQVEHSLKRRNGKLRLKKNY